MSFPNDFIIENDNTTVVKPKIFEKVPRVLNQNEYIVNDKGRKIIKTRKEAYISPDKRTDFQKKEDYKQGSAKQQMQEAKKIEQGVASILPIAAITVAQATPAAPFVNTALAASGAIGLGKQADEGTLGLNLETAGNIAAIAPIGIKGIQKLLSWRPYLPIGSSNTVYRQGTLDILDDYQKIGIVRPISEETANLKIAGQRSPLTKTFTNNLMFNAISPFYGSPQLFEPIKYKAVLVGDMSKSSAIWKQLRHKGHKHIFQPYVEGTLQAPLSEFDIYRRAPFNFGWFKTSRNTFNYH